MKMLPKVRGKLTREKTLEKLAREVDILERLQGVPNVVTLEECFEDANQVMIGESAGACACGMRSELHRIVLKPSCSFRHLPSMQSRSFVREATCSGSQRWVGH